MKPKPPENALAWQEQLDELARTLSLLPDCASIRAFLLDLCTPAELQAMADRWQVVQLLQQGLSYRAIHDRTGVSVTTIGRVARFLELGNGGYQAALKALNERENTA